MTASSDHPRSWKEASDQLWVAARAGASQFTYQSRKSARPGV